MKNQGSIVKFGALLVKYSTSKSEKTSLLLEQFLIDIGKKSGLLIN